ncbi:unnamed protein product [Cunninghamella blakesleeana]
MALFIGRLPPSIKNYDLEDIFIKFGKITRCEVKKGKSFSYGFVEYDNMDDAYDAMEETDGMELMVLELLLKRLKVVYVEAMKEVVITAVKKAILPETADNVPVDIVDLVADQDQEVEDIEVIQDHLLVVEDIEAILVHHLLEEAVIVVTQDHLLVEEVEEEEVIPDPSLEAPLVVAIEVNQDHLLVMAVKEVIPDLFLEAHLVVVQVIQDLDQDLIQDHLLVLDLVHQNLVNLVHLLQLVKVMIYLQQNMRKPQNMKKSQNMKK